MLPNSNSTMQSHHLLHKCFLDGQQGRDNRYKKNYKYKVGFGVETQESTEGSSMEAHQIQIGLNVGYKIFIGSIEYSYRNDESSGWSKNNKETWGNETEISLEIIIPSGVMTVLTQEVGKCGEFFVKNSKIKRIDTTLANNTKTIIIYIVVGIFVILIFCFCVFYFGFYKRKQPKYVGGREKTDQIE